MSVELGLAVSEHGKAVVLAVRGEVDMATAPRLRQRLVGLADEGARFVVVDLDEVEVLDSVGLGVIVGGLKRVRGAGGELVLVCTRPRILGVLRLTRLDRALDVFGSLADAIAAAD